MIMSDIGEDFSEPYELLDALRELRIDVEHWSRSKPRDDVDIDLTEMSGRLNEVSFTKREILESAAESLGDEARRTLLTEVIPRVERERDKPEAEDLQTLANQFCHAGSPWIDALVDAGDRKLAATPDAGLILYRQAIEGSPRPSLHAEIGYLLLSRLGIDDVPYSEFDCSVAWWSTSQSRGDMRWTNSLRPNPELITEKRLSGRVIPPAARTKALALALDSYGRAYSYYLTHASALEEKCQPADGAELDWTDLWRQFLVLDGLRVALLELGKLHAAHLTCASYAFWSQAFNDATNGLFDDSPLRERFAETSGYVKGRDVELAVQQAVEEARQKVVVSDPDSFATRVAEAVTAQLGSVPIAPRARIEDELKAQLRSAWTRPPDSVREQIVEAEWLKGVLEVHEGRDYTAVTVFYGKAVESLLRYLSRSDDLLSEFRRQLLHERITLRWLSRAPSNLVAQLIEVIDLRNPAAHGESGSYRPIPRSPDDKDA